MSRIPRPHGWFHGRHVQLQGALVLSGTLHLQITFFSAAGRPKPPRPKPEKGLACHPCEAEQGVLALQSSLPGKAARNHRIPAH